MGQVTFELPQHSLDALSLPDDELAAIVRMAAAMKLYELERISSGAAAELAGGSQTGLFVATGGIRRRNIPVHRTGAS